MHFSLPRPIGLNLAAFSLAVILHAPVHAQTLAPFTGTYYGGITSYTQLTPTTQEIFSSDTSTDASNGLDFYSDHVFLTISGNNYFLTPNTISTFVFSASDGSSVSGTVTENTGSFMGGSQAFTAVFSISDGTGRFVGATGNILASNGTSNLSGSQSSFQVLGTAPVPEASTIVSFGLLLALGLGGLVIAAKRRKA